MAMLTAVLLTGLAAAAGGATLSITGDRGVDVSINGTPIGRLPLDGPITLGPGKHLVSGRLAGAHDFLRELEIDSKVDVIHLRLDMIPLSRRDAVAYSLILAGTGQRYLGRGKSGWLLGITEVGGLLTALVSELNMQNSRDDFLRAQEDYAAAIVLVEIEQSREAMNSNWQDMKDAESLRDTAATFAIAAISLSVLDVLLRFPALETGPGPAPVAAGFGPADGRGGSSGFHVGLGFKF